MLSISVSPRRFSSSTKNRSLPALIRSFITGASVRRSTQMTIIRTKVSTIPTVMTLIRRAILEDSIQSVGLGVRLTPSSTNRDLERLNGQHRVELEVDGVLNQLLDLVPLDTGRCELHRPDRGHGGVGEILVGRLHAGDRFGLWMAERIDDELDERAAVHAGELGGARIYEVHVLGKRYRFLVHRAWLPQLGFGERRRGGHTLGEHVEKLLDAVEIGDDAARAAAGVGDGEQIPDGDAVGRERLNEHRIAERVLPLRRLVELGEEVLL